MNNIKQYDNLTIINNKPILRLSPHGGRNDNSKNIMMMSSRRRQSDQPNHH